ncbi:MAG: hypothetical protein NTX90_17365, partial [Alphaproteobacteria bacterium]|nr:hypothetical protein [Alphaproteobacteria bacterium]
WVTSSFNVVCVFGVWLFSLACFATSASAQINIPHRFGSWTNFEGRAADGKNVCGMDTGGEYLKGFTIKHFQDSPFFTLQVFNPVWNVPRQAQVTVAIRLGGQFNSGSLGGTAHPPPRHGGTPFVEVNIPYEGSSSFWQAFRWANTGYLDFLTGNEGSWLINLTGSNAATQQYMRCVERMGFSRQPFSTPPTQRTPSETFPSATPPRDGGRKSPF